MLKVLKRSSGLSISEKLIDLGMKIGKDLARE